MKNLEQLRADLQSDEDLRNKLLACKDEEALNATLADAGYEVTFADTQEYITKQKAELTDEELSAVAGGGFWIENPDNSVNVPSGIACVIVGAGVTCWINFGDDEDD